METTYNKHSHHNFQKIVHSDHSTGFPVAGELGKILPLLEKLACPPMSPYCFCSFWPFCSKCLSKPNGKPCSLYSHFNMKLLNGINCKALLMYDLNKKKKSNGF